MREGVRSISLGRLAAIEPENIFEPAEPFHLPSGELPCGDFDLLDSVVERRPAADVIDQLGISGGLGGGFGEGWIFGEQPAHFLEPAGGDHLLHARVDSPIDFVAFPGQADPDDAMAGRMILLPLLLEGRDGFAGEFEHFQCADEASLIAGMDTLGGGGIEFF